MNFAELILGGTAVGLGATLFTDLVGIARQGWAKINGFYSLVGRWLGALPRHGFRHNDIRNTPPVFAETALGWCAHVAMGVLFGIGFLVLFGPEALSAPSIWQGLSFGLGTVLVPWLVFQPLFGWGIATSKFPNPWSFRRRSIFTHTVFGFGLWVSAMVLG